MSSIPDDRVGIIGPNGVGKSTLMDIDHGAARARHRHRGDWLTIHIGYFDQHSEDVLKNPNQRVIDYLKKPPNWCKPQTAA
jgi:ATP-binding cassette subfamily F protein uup